MEMTLKDALTVKAGTVIKHNYITDPIQTVTATGFAIVEGMKWKIPVDGETSHREGKQYFITGLKGHCWSLCELKESICPSL